MSRIEKLLRKFMGRPETVRYMDIEKILLFIGFEKIQAKGSHVKFKHSKMRFDIIIPIHNNECKTFYKKQVREQIISIVTYENTSNSDSKK